MKTFLIVALILVAILAWFPWQSEESAENMARGLFESEQAGIIDGCGFSCEGCGVDSSQKIPFGYLIGLKYKCGMCGPDCRFRGESRFVTPFGFSVIVNKY